MDKNLTLFAFFSAAIVVTQLHQRIERGNHQPGGDVRRHGQERHGRGETGHPRLGDQP